MPPRSAPVATTSSEARGPGLTSSGLGALRAPVPSVVNMSSLLPALGKQSTRNLHRGTGRLGGDPHSGGGSGMMMMVMSGLTDPQ